MLTLPIAMCTYNGEEFLKEQLESIAAQTRPPDELIICDDCSSNRTKVLLEEFSEAASFPVKLYFNQENLGYIKNFEKAISLCHGDIIALSDQDDKWHSNKLEIIEKGFDDPNIGLVFSNGRIIDENGTATGQTIWQAARFSKDLQNKFQSDKAHEVLCTRLIVSGCTMAFRRSLWPYIKPLPTETLFFHDSWIALMISLLAKSLPVEGALIDYRRHSSQVTFSNIYKTSTRGRLSSALSGDKLEQYRKHIKQLDLVQQRIECLSDQIPEEKNLFVQDYINQHREHLKVRLSLSPQFMPRIATVCRELVTGRYHQLSNGFKSAVGDLIRG